MIGAIAGDIIGSVYEFSPIKTTDFPLFHPYSNYTDDSVLTLATAEVLLEGGDYAETYREYCRLYPNAGYGEAFFQWSMSDEVLPYNSWGNGSAMRVSPVAYAFDTLEEVLEEAEASASVTHNHPEGIRGAQAIAGSVFLARQRENKTYIRRFIEEKIGYDLRSTVESIRPTYRFDVSCQGSVPPAIIAFLESSSFEEAVRLAVSLGGDSDTLGCMAGAIAGAFYGVPEEIQERAMGYLPSGLRATADEFLAQFPAV